MPVADPFGSASARLTVEVEVIVIGSTWSRLSPFGRSSLSVSSISPRRVSHCYLSAPSFPGLSCEQELLKHP